MEKLSRKEADVNLILIQMFLEEYASALHYDGRQFYSQLLKFLNDYKRKFLSNTSPFYNTIKSVIKKPPIYSLLSYSDCLEDPNPAGRYIIQRLNALFKFIYFFFNFSIFLSCR